MMMYDELIRQMKACCKGSPCEGVNCGFDSKSDLDCIEQLLTKAVDAIEELQKKLYFQDITTAQIVNMYMPFFIPKWIPITERLPDKRGDYLVFTSNSTITIATWGGERFYISEFAAVTHWMPLPKKPEMV